MNILHVNDDLARGLKGVFGNTRHTSLDMDNLNKTPLLTYDFGNASDQEVKDRLAKSFQDVSQVPDTPFVSFRYWIRLTSMTHYGVASRFSNTELNMFGVVQSRNSGNKLLLRMNMHPPRTPNEISWSGRLYRYNDFHELNINNMPEKGVQEAERIYGTLAFGMETMCAEYMRPDQHVAAVYPHKHGKSVEWIKARTHYTVVHRNHAANRADIVKGATVVSNENEHVTRIAHTRRAHYRILRSERFKGKRNQRIFIRSQWIGPEEWNDGSGQIYRIADIKRK